MKIEEINNRIAELRKDFNESVQELEEIIKEAQKPKRWRACTSQIYYTIQYGNGILYTDCLMEEKIDLDDARYNQGNYFRTEREAKEALKRMLGGDK